jgi:hypothetical protein
MSKRKNSGCGCLLILVLLGLLFYIVANPRTDYHNEVASESANLSHEERTKLIKELEKKVSKIPAAHTRENLRIYNDLAKLDPENERYKKKIEFYTAQFDAWIGKIKKDIVIEYRGKILSIEHLDSATCMVRLSPSLSPVACANVAENIGYYISNAANKTPTVRVFIGNTQIAYARPTGSGYSAKIEVKEYKY